MSSAVASSSKPAETKVVEKEKRKEVQFGVLEEGDELGDFPVEDWDDAQTELARLDGAAPGSAKSGGNKLWDDDWDDDDIEDELTVMLRKMNKAQGGGMNEPSKAKGGDAMEASKAKGGNAMEH
ncbi:hypothetical protein DFH06DRAFT_1327623 [Mycena polygramma]|nr:hypothetical protein DFH06DRAFT_1327623 [Mycena polygramma]